MEAKKRARESRISAYTPYSKQREFHEAGFTHRERLLRAGNQLGKCVTVASVIDTPTGGRAVADLLVADRPFEVLAWDGVQPVRAWASRPFRKPGVHHCYRLTMADGQWVEMADFHRVLCADGWRYCAEVLPSFGLVPPQSIEECARSVHGEGAQDWFGTPSDCLGGCSLECHRCGGLPHLGSDSGLVCLPSQADAQPHILPWCSSDDHQLAHTNTGLAGSGRPSNWGGLRALAGQFAGSEETDVCSAVRQWFGSHQEFPLPASVSEADPQSWIGSARAYRQESLSSPSAVAPKCGNYIARCEYIGLHEVYDFEVQGWHNYIAGGLIHHNTMAGGAEASYHLTGAYPTWWQGRRWERPTRAWAGGPSGELVRDGLQRVLLGPADDWGTGTIPKSALVDVSRANGVKDLADTITVRNLHGGTSTLKFKTYDQGRIRWQSETLDWVWFDEEPPEDVYTEGLTRTNATGGLVWLTFTPLMGVSNVVMRFLRETSPDRADIVMTIEDAEHISPAARAQIIASYPAHERDARTRGIPILGSGRVFPFPREMIVCDAIPIPRHWARLGGLDFGWDHPFAAVRIAHDRDSDTIYVTDCYRAREETPAVQAAALRGWGQELGFAWPHDGLQHDKGSGEQLADLYKRQGLNMLWERAQFADDRGSGVEAGVFEMLDRMQTNRLKVFRHLNDWLDEFDLYHRVDGKLVKERDDLISATRYALMMLRHAKAGPSPNNRYSAGSSGPRRSPMTA